MEDYGNVGRYRLLAPLAQGGMAEIFLARQEGPAGFGKTVVVKRVLGHLAQDDEFIHMFLDEARLAAQLSHPNVVQVFDFGEDGGSYFLAMEYLAGDDLSTILRALRKKKRVMPPQIAAVVASLACEGLHYAHTLTGETGEPLGIVHRDVSPSNILVTYQGAVKVLDFGIAKAAGKIVKTEAGMVKGKFMYMSPEQARGHVVDARSDVFALGALLYEMVTGIRVFQRDNQLAMLLAVTEEEIKRPRLLQPSLPEELEAIIMRALERDLDQRFPSAQAMREAVDDFLAQRTYAPSHVQLKQFLSHLLGDDHIRERLERPKKIVVAMGSNASAKIPSLGGVRGGQERGASIGAQSKNAPAVAPPPAAEPMIDEETRIGGIASAAPSPGASPRRKELESMSTRIGAASLIEGDGLPPPPAIEPELEGETRIRDIAEIRPPSEGARARAAVNRESVARAPLVAQDGFDEDDYAPAKKSKLPLILVGLVLAGVVGGGSFILLSPPAKTEATGEGANGPPKASEVAPQTTKPITKVAPTRTTANPTAQPRPDPEQLLAKADAELEAAAAAAKTDTSSPDVPPPDQTPAAGSPSVAAHQTAPTVPSTASADLKPPVKAHVRRGHRPRPGHQKSRTQRAIKTAPASSASGAKGLLSINCIPWCKVFVDGKDTGKRSPALNMSISVGKHQIKVVNPPSGLEKFKEVVVSESKPTRAIIKF